MTQMSSFIEIFSSLAPFLVYLIPGYLLLRFRALRWWTILLLVLMVPLSMHTGSQAIRREPNWQSRIILGEIFTAQMAYFSERNEYARGPQVFSLLNMNFEDTGRYSFWCDDAVEMNHNGDNLGLDPKSNWPFRQKPEASYLGFTCIAIGNIDRDPFLDATMINDRKTLTHLLIDHYDQDAANFLLQPPSWQARIKSFYLKNTWEPARMLLVLLTLSMVCILLDELNHMNKRQERNNQG